MEDINHTDDDWAVVREAVPSFASTWAAFIADDGYVDIHRPSADVPNEYELVLSHRVIDDDYEYDIWELLLSDEERYWQVADGFAMPRPLPPYDDV